MMMRSGRNGSGNPFDSNNKNHFPGHSPMFRARTMASPEIFQWSIDNLAVLKPVDIDASTHNPDHIYSPTTEQEIQRRVDRFFSQKTILPSPWKPERTSTKHVTFSPAPPQTEFYGSDSLMESPLVHLKEASCQTAVTFPVDFNLVEAVGQQHCVVVEGDGDWANSSLRRKLFGKPGNQDSKSFSMTEGNCKLNGKESPPGESVGGVSSRAQAAGVSPELLVNDRPLDPSCLHPTSTTTLRSSFDSRVPFPAFLSPLGLQYSVSRGSSEMSTPGSGHLQTCCSSGLRGRHIATLGSPFGAGNMLAAVTPIRRHPPPPPPPPRSPGRPAGPFAGHYHGGGGGPLPSTHTPFLSPISHLAARSSRSSSSGSSGKITSTPAGQDIAEVDMLEPEHYVRHPGRTEARGDDTDSQHSSCSPTPAALNFEDLEEEEEGEGRGNPRVQPNDTMAMSVDVSEGEEEEVVDKCPTSMLQGESNAGPWVGEENLAMSGMLLGCSGQETTTTNVEGESVSLGYSSGLPSTIECLTGIADSRCHVGSSMQGMLHFSGRRQNSDSGINMSRVPPDALSQSRHHKHFGSTQQHPPVSMVGSPFTSPEWMEPTSRAKTASPRELHMSHDGSVTPSKSESGNNPSHYLGHETPRSSNSFRNSSYWSSHAKNVQLVSGNVSSNTANTPSFSLMIRDIMKKKDILKAKLKQDPIVSLEAAVGEISPFRSPASSSSSDRYSSRRTPTPGRTFIRVPLHGCSHRGGREVGDKARLFTEGKENAFIGNQSETPKSRMSLAFSPRGRDWKRSPSQWNPWS